MLSDGACPLGCTLSWRRQSSRFGAPLVPRSIQTSGRTVSDSNQVVFLEVPEFGRRVKFSRDGRHATSSAVVAVEQVGEVFQIRTASGSIYSGRLQPGVDAPMFGINSVLHKSTAPPPPPVESSLDNQTLVISADSGLYSFTIVFQSGRGEITIEGPSGVTTVSGRYTLSPTQVPKP